MKRILALLLILIVAVGGLTYYSFKIEPYRLKVTQYSLNETESKNETLRIVQFSDLHIKEDYTVENLARVVDEINKLNADLVIFTGDLYDDYSKYNDNEAVIEQLSAIESKYGKMAIWGNRDYGGGAAQHYPSIMHAGGFDLIKNEHRTLIHNDKQVLITGLDDKLLGDVRMPDTRPTIEFDYKLLLSHEPDILDYYVEDGYNLSLSGHSHGGQINIPFLPFVNRLAVSNTEFATKYVAGFYDLIEDGSQIIFVNTGLGTTHISARLNVVPEITVFDISL